MFPYNRDTAFLNMQEVVWSVNILVALDVAIALTFVWWVLNYDNLYNK